MLVEGGKSAEVAAAVGIDTARLWRQMHRSLRFRHYIRRHVERCRLVMQPAKPAPETKPADAAASERKPEYAESDSSQTKLDSNRTESDPNWTESSSDLPRSAYSRLAYMPPSWSDGPPPSRARLHRSIIDLPGPDTRGEEAFSGNPHPPAAAKERACERSG